VFLSFLIDRDPFCYAWLFRQESFDVDLLLSNKVLILLSECHLEITGKDQAKTARVAVRIESPTFR
jgi:hypothetical protein